ncbi:MAG: trypsin-like peptidase domain-containing protein [Pirellulaceae bacterium]|nr:trypsin-like peptidase domain-containing protein [Pirellulaceae bacterium]
MPDPTFRTPGSRLASLALLTAGLVALAAGTALASEQRQTPIVKAVNAVAQSVVNIHGRKTVRAENASLGGDSLRQVNGMGTGIVIDARGYILTNYHVVEGVSNIQVSLHDERAAIARLVAHDPKTDLAIIKIEAKDPLPVIRFGTSCDLMHGEPVIAVGNAYGYEHTVTEGIISALHRSVQVSDEQKYSDLIQTSASINPGNSGGPLLNIDGYVIGLNVAVRVGAQGIGFALPIDEALEVAARLMSIEKLEQTTHGIAGKTVCEPEQRSFLVTGIRADSPAAKAGLKSGDTLTQIGNRRIERSLDVELALLGQPVGEETALEVLRDGQPITASLAVGSFSRSHLKPALADRVWTTLGLRLAPMDEGTFKSLNTRYRGGLQVTGVRPDSPASAQGIRRGDVLVGMHVWETISLENVAYILDREDLARLDPVVFYLVRGSDTLYGHLRLAAKP